MARFNSRQSQIFNSSSLGVYNYTVYGNGTVSNGTNCYLMFGNYKPTLFENGTFFNVTSCDSPINPIQARGGIGISWAIILALFIPFSLYNLHKFGRSLGGWKYRRKCRKWQWYWVILLEICSALTGFFSIDLDRDYLPMSSLKLYSTFYSITLPLALCTMWEVCKYWQYVEDMTGSDTDDSISYLSMRSLPLNIILVMSSIFYLSTFISFILTLFNNLIYWPISVDLKWKIGIYFAFASWILTWFLIALIMYFSTHKIRYPPKHILISQSLILILLCFHLSFVWNKEFAPFNIESRTLFICFLGYLPILLLAFTINLNGLVKSPPETVFTDIRGEDGIRLDDYK